MYIIRLWRISESLGFIWSIPPYKHCISDDSVFKLMFTFLVNYYINNIKFKHMYSIIKDGKNPKNSKYVAVVFGLYCGFWFFNEVLWFFIKKKLKGIK